MSQTLVIKKKCHRCPRVEEEEVSPERIQELTERADPPALRIEVGGHLIADFPHLCEECANIVHGYITQAVTPQTSMSSRRKVKKNG